jgi:polar amino acid transport system ATP-binding protein
MSVADTVALRVQGLHKSFDRLVVLRGIDLDVGEHEVVCLIGASGSGKSTFLRCINLLETIDAGRIFIEGEEITTGRRNELPGGIVFQAFNCSRTERDGNVTAPTEAIDVAPRRRGVAIEPRWFASRTRGRDPDRLSAASRRVAIVRARDERRCS